MRNAKIIIFCIIIPFLTLPIDSSHCTTNAVYPLVKATDYLNTSIPSSTDVYPEGADVFNKTLEDQENFLAEDYDVNSLDSVQVYFMIDRSSVDLEIFFHGAEYEVIYEGLSPRSSAYNKTFGFRGFSGRVQFAFSNPGVTPGGDSIHIFGFTRLIPNGRQDADPIISVPEYKPFFEGWIVVIVATGFVFARKYNKKR